MSVNAYIALGSNQQDPAYQIQLAINAIAVIPNTRLIKVSPFYQTSAVGFVEQEDFVNAVVQVTTQLSALELMDALLKVEKQQGRVRDQRWGPRIIDCDIILFGEEQIDLPGLTVPHKEMHNRLFVLKPLADLFPEYVLPEVGLITKRIAELSESGDQRLTML